MNSLNHEPDSVEAKGLAEVCAAEEALVDLEEAILDILDIETYAHTGKRKPKARLYRFRVGKTLCEVKEPIINGAEILSKAGKVPPEKYTLRQILHGGELKLIGLAENVDLRAPCIERFRAMPRTAQDG